MDHLPPHFTNYAAFALELTGQTDKQGAALYVCWLPERKGDKVSWKKRPKPVTFPEAAALGNPDFFGTSSAPVSRRAPAAPPASPGPEVAPAPDLPAFERGRAPLFMD